jgi:hypothetical protein
MRSQFHLSHVSIRPGVRPRAGQAVRLGVTALCVAAAAMGCTSGESADAISPVKVAAARHQPAGKPGSGVVVQHSVPDKIAAGQTVALRLQFSGVTAPDGATVEVRDPSLRETLVSLRLAQGERRTLEVPVVSRTDGMQFIDVATTQDGRTTVQSVPMRVGSGALMLKPEGSRQLTTTGEAVISLPLSTQ